MEMMGCQYQNLQEALSGYFKTGIPFVAYDGNLLKPAGIGDDIGIYYFIPKIAHAFGISLDQSINVFFISVISVSLFLGIIGVFLYFKKWSIRCLGAVELVLLAYRSFSEGGIYTIPLSIAMAIIPLFLYFTERRKVSLSFLIFLSWAGVVIGVGNYLRIHAGTGVLIFLIIISFFHLQILWKQKIILITLILISTLAPMTYFNQLLNQKDNYLRRNNPAYERVLREHPFWHSVYIGFGFLNNDYGIKYKDEVAIEKVRSISPKTTYLSEEYEAILKEQVLKLIKTKPLFVLRTIFAKFGVISLYLLIFANVGLIAVYFHRKCWPLETAFWGAMIFNSLFGVLVIPDERYLTGFITFATLYGIISIEEAIEHIPWGRFGALLRRKGEEL